MAKREDDTVVYCSKKRKRWNTENPELLLPTRCERETRPVGIYCPADQLRVGVQHVALGSTYVLTGEEIAECIALGKKRRAQNEALRATAAATGTFGSEGEGESEGEGDGTRAPPPSPDRQTSTDVRFARRRNPETLDVQGVIGEYAFCKLFRCPMTVYDTECRRAGEEKNFDAKIGEHEWTVDVKTTLYDDAPLHVDRWKCQNAPDLYALMILTADRGSDDVITDETACSVSYRGMATSRDVFRFENRIRTAKRNGRESFKYSMDQSALRTFSELSAQSLLESRGSP